MQKLIVLILRPEEIINLTIRHYKKHFKGWSSSESIERRLFKDERILIDKYFDIEKGKEVLDLFCGAGREAIELAKMGFNVTAIDAVENMIKCAKKIVKEKGVDNKITFQLQNTLELNLPDEKYNYAVIFFIMYATIPGRQNRINLLQKIHNSLKDKGILILSTYICPRFNISKNHTFVEKFIIRLTSGNWAFQKTDIFEGGREFHHYFTSIEEIKSEIEEANFRLLEFLEYRHKYVNISVKVLHFAIQKNNLYQTTKTNGCITISS